MRIARAVAFVVVLTIIFVVTGTLLPDLFEGDEPDPQGVVGAVPIPGSPDEVAVFVQEGYVFRASLSDTFEPAVFGDLTEFVPDDLDPEEGVLGATFDQDYPESPYIYISFTTGENYIDLEDPEAVDSPRRTLIARFRVDDGIDNSSLTEVLDLPQPDAFHNAGDLAFGPDGYLYAALGDGGPGGDPFGTAQDSSNIYGTLIRIDVSAGSPGYEVPDDNPFAGDESAQDVIYAYGFRNPWRFSFDRETDDLWAADVGESLWEEINIVEPGGNHGWSCLEGRETFDEEDCTGGDYVDPVYVYTRSGGCAVIGGYVYRGEALPSLQGQYIFGDFCTGAVWALDPVTQEAEKLHETDERVASFAELPDGELLVVSWDGGIFRMETELEPVFDGLAELILETKGEG